VAPLEPDDPVAPGLGPVVMLVVLKNLDGDGGDSGSGDARRTTLR
jgi:hypothetical protein